MTREAYSREVASFGFWFGDDRFAEPAFYAYVAPEPAGLAEEPPRPAAAWWDPRDGSHLAVLRYADARACSDPRLTRDARRGQRRACPEPSVGIHIERDDRTR